MTEDSKNQKGDKDSKILNSIHHDNENSKEEIETRFKKLVLGLWNMGPSDKIEAIQYKNYITYLFPEKEWDESQILPYYSKFKGFYKIPAKLEDLDYRIWDHGSERFNSVLTCAYCGKIIKEYSAFSSPGTRKFCDNGDLCKNRYRRFKDLVKKLHSEGKISDNEAMVYLSNLASVFSEITHNSERSESRLKKINFLKFFKEGTEKWETGFITERWINGSKYCTRTIGPDGNVDQEQMIDIKDFSDLVAFKERFHGVEFTVNIWTLEPIFKITDNEEIIYIGRPSLHEEIPRCKYCHKELTGKRSGAGFCNSLCYDRYRNEKRKGLKTGLQNL